MIAAKCKVQGLIKREKKELRDDVLPLAAGKSATDSEKQRSQTEQLRKHQEELEQKVLPCGDLSQY